MTEFSSKNSLGNQGWWSILWYLIQIGDWPAALGMLRPSAYRKYEKKYLETHAKN